MGKPFIGVEDYRTYGMGSAGFNDLFHSTHPLYSALCIVLLGLLLPGAGSTAPLTLSLEPAAIAASTPTTDSSFHVSSLAVSAESTRGPSAVFMAGFDPIQWTGFVTAFSVAAGTGAASATGLWGTAPASGTTAARPLSTATWLDAPDFVPADRVVLSSTTAGGIESGIPWTWDSLATDQKNAMNSDGERVDALGSQRLSYLRGDHAREIARGGTFRNRASRHGDIVNSKLWYLAGVPASGDSAKSYAAFKSRWSARDAMLYVGANDGMLHGFSASTGQEKIAYVPVGAYARLPSLTNARYTHHYLVDGSPFTADLQVDGTWKTYLAGFPGLGGKGYFVLDVTDPVAFLANNAASLVVMDQTATTDADIGHITSEPVREHGNAALTRQISQLNNGRWALITGNGYNSASERAVLLIQYLDGKRELLKIPQPAATPAGTASGNGLSAPRLIDLNGDHIPDIAYAGDLLGNLWKFDLSSGNPDDWAVAFGGAPLYVARDASLQQKTQQITSAPVWLAHPQGGITVVFGTGRNLTDADRTNTSVQTIYGIRDDTAVMREAGKVKLVQVSGPIGTGRDALVQQTLGSSPTATIASRALWTVSSRPVPSSGAASKKGWYLDLPAGEQVVGNPGWFEGHLVDVSSTETATGKMWLTTLNALDGRAPKSQIYAYTAVDATGTASASGTASRIETGLRTTVTDRSRRTEKGLCAPGQPCLDRMLLPFTALRPSWRQLQ